MRWTDPDLLIDAAADAARLDRDTVAHVWGHHRTGLTNSHFPLHYAEVAASVMLRNLTVSPADEVPQRCDEVRALLKLAALMDESVRP